MSYTQGMLMSLVHLSPNIKVTVVYWDSKTLSGYRIIEQESISYIANSKLKDGKLQTLINKLRPDLIYLSGWMDKNYVKSTKRFKYKNRSAIVVMGADNQWMGTLRQNLGKRFISVYLNGFVDYFWVAGSPQYHYARLLGFANERILHNLYSANTHDFKSASVQKERFMFLGRLASEKGVLELVKAYNSLPVDRRKEWPLILIGDGPLRSEIERIKCDEVILMGFLQGEQLTTELLKGGVYVAPSHFEPWGVSIHEMALLGYPMIVTKSCGAATQFLIHGYNGFVLESGEVDVILHALQVTLRVETGQLELFSNRSRILGNRINSEISAASLLSVLQ